MPACRDCGEEISWYPRNDEEVAKGKGRIHPPIEETGQTVLVLIDGKVHTKKAFRRHLCDPQKVVALQREREERRATAERQREEQRQVNEDVERQRLEAWRVARARGCPTCKAQPGYDCTNQTKGKHAGRPTRWPHPARYK